MSNSNDFTYTIESGGLAAVIKVGENVLGGSQALAYTSILQELIQKGVKCIIADLCAVQAMNSSGLGMLVGGLSTLKKHECTLMLASVPEKVYNLLDMTHLNKVFIVSESVPAALESCNK